MKNYTKIVIRMDAAWAENAHMTRHVNEASVTDKTTFQHTMDMLRERIEEFPGEGITILSGGEVLVTLRYE